MLLGCLVKFLSVERILPRRGATMPMEIQDFATDSLGGVLYWMWIGLDVESMVMLIIFSGRKYYFVCGEQRLYNHLFMKECSSIFGIL